MSQCHWVIPIIDVLKSTLEDLEDNGVGTVKQEILNSLDERFGGIEDSTKISSIQVCQKAKDKVLNIQYANESLNPEIECQEPVQIQHEQKKPTIWERMTERMKKHGRPDVRYDESHGDNETGCNSSTGSMEVDLSMYCAEEVILLRGDGSDPFQYWQIKKTSWAKLPLKLPPNTQAQCILKGCFQILV
ncbi:Hypothetical predicted protein [Paramuricea clavata]|uniref:Uncharacterized protein n=1 Tax=Paramuricea clavata TaxID=317549 RepID=A0A7D9IHX7_PARCT|nr:Hypothetical predicted protein [Paramuricea clavata]